MVQQSPLFFDWDRVFLCKLAFFARPSFCGLSQFLPWFVRLKASSRPCSFFYSVNILLSFIFSFFFSFACVLDSLALSPYFVVLFLLLWFCVFRFCHGGVLFFTPILQKKCNWTMSHCTNCTFLF